MADIKAMFSNMANGSAGSGDAASPPKPPKKTTIEQTYQKKSQLEHILLRPDTYIGSVQKTKRPMWIYDTEQKIMVQKETEYVPGLVKIFDEILVNAADNKQKDKNMNCIKIDIDPEQNKISIWNNGRGIPVVMHKEEKMYVPTMIFGHLLTSSNYNDEEEKVTGGRNGYGAKLCNIFSEKFIVETASKQYKYQFKQTWGTNMTKVSEPKLKQFHGEDFTRITFWPDLAKFKMEKLDADIVGIMSRRAFDVAASTRGIKVFLNGERLPVKTFKDYVDLYIRGQEDDEGNSLKVVYEQPNERWEVAVTISTSGFQQVSFVNSLATTKGGRHVDYVVDMIVKQVIEIIKKKNKGGTAIKPSQVKQYMWIFINCLIVNPGFDSQTKEYMDLNVKNFGSKCNLSEKFMQSVAKSGLVEYILSWAKNQQKKELAKNSAGRKQLKLKGVPKLEDANEAGSVRALECTLILTEGDSAKSLAVSGLGVIGRDYYGVFPLRGKLLNVREATHKQITENAEINNLVKIIGLKYHKKYNTIADMKTLRYGKVMIMTDQDQDGSHIKGLVINFIHHNWPELLRLNFLEEFITPIVKAKKKNSELSFYSLPEFEEWKRDTPNHNTYQIKYYKGLGTSTSKEAKEYFSNMARHRICFRYSGQEDDDHIVLAFSKKHIEARKEWLTKFMVESKHRKEMGLPEKYLYTKDTKFVNYKDFVNLELVLFSNADNVRSIPSLVDGMKPGQRKVLFTCLKRNDKREVKVAQLAGSVAEHSAYHHGEVSLSMTIVNLAQNFVGSNNINVLEPRGQFGTRLTGGKDCASARYIFTKLSPLTRMIFHPNDDALLKHEYDDNLKIEPVWYIPIIPMILVNGADGIGTGWMTRILNYNPRDIAKCIRNMLEDEEPKELVPWYKNFKGTVEYCGDGRYCISGEIIITGPNTIEITELPVGTWTQNYKENTLELMLNGSEKVKPILKDYKEYNTDTTVKFVVTLLNDVASLEKEGLHKVFKLQSLFSTGSMCCFDELACLRRFDTVMDILKDFYTLRLKFYQKRKDFLEGMLDAEAKKLSNQARFIMEKCDGSLVVENKKRKVIVDELIRRGYEPDPVKDWKQRNDDEDAEEPADGDEEESQEETSTTKKKKEPADTEANFKNLTEVKKFDYLLGMSMWMLTEEKKNELLKQRDKKLHELEVLRKKSNKDLWREDLDAFLEKLAEVEEKERKDELEVKTVKQPGKKKAKIQETLPTTTGTRVIPIISEDLKKKIQTAVKLKENKIKKEIKKEVTEGDEPDEFDEMVKSKKTLKDKLGSSEDAEKKARKKKPTDGLKQTKLNFERKPANGSPKKKGRKKKDDIDNETSGEENAKSDSESISSPVVSPVRERTIRRAATKVQKYNFSDEEDDNKELSDNEDLHENTCLEERESEPVLLSDSDEDKPPPPRLESSEDLFDSLVGTKKDPEEQKDTETEPTSQKRKIISSQSDSDQSDIQPKKATKPKGEKKPRKPAKKKKFSDSEDDEVRPKKAKTQKKAVSSSNDKEDLDESDDMPFASQRSRPGRGAAKTNYVFSDDSDDNY